jgi:hypothetical protein
MQHYISNHFLRHFVRLTRQNNLDPVELLKAVGLSKKSSYPRVLRTSSKTICDIAHPYTEPASW